VHFPYCAAKCGYCDFFSVAAEGHDTGAMVGAILAEAHQRAPRRPQTVFLGGGTPSLLAIPELRRLLDGLDGVTGFRDSAVEVTVECNPESLDRDKAAALLDLGATRLSIGFQSLRDETLQLFGRVHDAAMSFRAYDAARAAGATELNIDLIFAAPDQDLAAWEADLARVLALGPEHLSAYDLTFEEDTLFRRLLDQGHLSQAPEELELELFWSTRRLSGAAGLTAYEVSNFARPGHECRHNQNYWRNGDYVGLGPSAVSHHAGARLANLKALRGYLERVKSGEPCLVSAERLAARQRLGETWWLGLRLAEGIDPARARACAGLAHLDPAADPALSEAQRLVELGLLERDGPRYRLTEAGLPLADGVARRFLVAQPA
jgi:oxygen-independent coproporphyrinogen III oxidase